MKTTNDSYPDGVSRKIFRILAALLVIGMLGIFEYKHSKPKQQQPEVVTKQVQTQTAVDQSSVKAEQDPTEAALNNMGFSLSNSVKISVK